jgi:hypothetical protein
MRRAFSQRPLYFYALMTRTRTSWGEPLVLLAAAAAAAAATGPFFTCAHTLVYLYASGSVTWYYHKNDFVVS